MWCFFYEPRRCFVLYYLIHIRLYSKTEMFLSPFHCQITGDVCQMVCQLHYVCGGRSTYSSENRINSLAHVDQRLLHALRALRNNDWSYIRGSPTHSHLLTNMAQDLGYPPSWGDPAQLPAFGGTLANITWRKLGVASRPNVGGFPCEIVHGGLQQKWGLGNSCTGNAAIRIAVAFVEAMALYLPVRYNFKDSITIAYSLSSPSGPFPSNFPYSPKCHSTHPSCRPTNHSSCLP